MQDAPKQAINTRQMWAWRLQQWPPAYFSLVMATGIVSIASFELGMRRFGLALFAINWLFYAALWLIALIRLIRYPDALRADLFSHTRAVGLFTWPAATGVLASQCLLLVSWPTTAKILWGLTLLLWLGLTYLVFGALTVRREKPALDKVLHGGWLVAVVAAQSVSVSGTLLATHLDAGVEPMRFISLATWLSGGMLYIWMMSIIFYRYTFLVMAPEDLSPPYWINMGAMAISTLAGALLIQAADTSRLLAGLLPFLQGMTLLFWATATWWIPMLIALGLWRHLYRRVPLKYNPHYWGAVFPLGMYTACTLHMARALDLPYLLPLVDTFIWLAISAWLITTLGLLRRLTNLPKPTHPTT